MAVTISKKLDAASPIPIAKIAVRTYIPDFLGVFN